MKKIPTIFLYDLQSPISGRVCDIINPECAWVFERDTNDEYVGGVLRKYDGVCCLVFDGMLWKRSVIKEGEPFPTVWRAVELDDINNAATVWEPVPDDNAHGLYNIAHRRLVCADEGTYELIGPGINGNPENVDSARLMRHDHAPSILIVKRTFETLSLLLRNTDVYGYVFTHPDGRKAKIHRTHFGLNRFSRGVQ